MKEVSFAKYKLGFWNIFSCMYIFICLDWWGFGVWNICRNLTRNMEADGNVLWVQTLGVFSLIQKGLLFILDWGPSISSSSRVHLLNIIKR